MWDTLIRGGTLVTVSGTARTDLAIEGERIAAIGSELGSARQVIDAAGMHVVPGGVDPHTHLAARFREQASAEDFYSGTVAAACGGVTTICDYMRPLDHERPLETLARWRTDADAKAVIDYGLHLILPSGEARYVDSIPELVEGGVPSFKVFMLSELGPPDREMLTILERASAARALVAIHAENGAMVAHLRDRYLATHRDGGPRYAALTHPELAEVEAVNRALAYAELTGAAIYLVHLSCARSIELVAAARRRGCKVYAETRPLYLFTDVSVYERADFDGARFLGVPPARARPNQDGLWAGLAWGDVAVVASDHSGWSLEQKAMGRLDFSLIPAGVPDLETERPLLYSAALEGQQLDLARFVAVTATNPARLFGLFPRKGVLAPGSDADIVLFDPTRRVRIASSELHSRAGYSPYEGVTVNGWPVMTLSRGRVICRNGEFVGQAGAGRFLARAPFDPVVL